MNAQGAQRKRVVLLSSSEPRDTELRAALATHLAPRTRAVEGRSAPSSAPLRDVRALPSADACAGAFEVWHEGLLDAGEPVARLADQVGVADAVVLLLTPHLLADDARLALAEAARRRGAQLVPVIGRACDWRASSFRDLTVLPASHLSVLTFPDPGVVWNDVAAALGAALGLAGVDAAGVGPRRPPTNLPARSLFVGRRNELEAVRVRLAGGGVAGITQRASVYGLGGIGKSSLALAYAHAHSMDYPGGVFWVRAEGDPVTALLVFSAELRAIAPPAVAEVLARVPPNDAGAVAAGVRLALQANPEPSLLVLDNVDADWTEHVPGHLVDVLVTTREPDHALGGHEARVRLDVLDRGDALALADALAGGCAGGDVAARDRVVLVELGGLAVAVEMAARAVKRLTKTWARYEVELRKQADVLLGDPKLLGTYRRGAFAAIDLSIARCTDPTARSLLESLAALAPERAPMDWAEAGAGTDPDALATLRAWEDLADAGAVTLDSDHREAALHRLVHRRLASTLGVETRETRAAAMAEVVHTWLRGTVDIGRVAEVELRVPHVELVLAAVERRGERPEWIGIADRLASHLKHRGVYPAARDLFQRVLAAAEQLDPRDDDRVGVQLNNLATVLLDLGDAVGARPLLERALAIDEKALGPDHPGVAIDLSNLATVLLDLGDAVGARPLLERALAIDKNALGPDHPNVAIRRSNLAMVLKHLGHTAGARLLLERALRIDEKALGPDHPNVAIDLSNLAMVLKDRGHAQRAVPLLERALAIDEKALGPDHPNVAIRLCNLAMVLKDLGDATGARPLLERALGIGEKALGPDHPNLAIHLSSLAMVLRDLGETARAWLLLERALRVEEKARGPHHPNVARGLSNLAMLQKDLGEITVARSLLERALCIANKALGPDHPDVAAGLSRLALVLQDLGDAAGARLLLERAVAIADRRLGPDHPRTQHFRDNLAALGPATPTR